MAGSGTGAEADVAVIGAGIGGLYMHYRLRELGLRAIGFEAGPDVGGTWWWNGYPGARCDVESLDYSYSFSPELLAEWQWSERFATQPEILRYIEHVAERFDLKRDIRFDTRVVAMTFDDEANLWTLETDGGDSVTVPFVVTAVGCLSAHFVPDMPGLEQFEGRWLRTSAWPQQGVEIKGKRVGIIGTGSSGIQSIPEIAKEAAHLTVFQRTPNFSLPARNGPVDPAHQAMVEADYPAYARKNRESRAGFQPRIPTQLMPPGWQPGRSALEASEQEREAVFETMWNAGGTAFTAPYTDLVQHIDANRYAAEFVHKKIREIVDDPEVAVRLTPTNHPFATKRLCLDSDYYATFNRENVTLVDIRAEPIERIVPEGLRTSERAYPLDVLIFATGFDAVTGPLTRLNITGSHGAKLTDRWADGPSTYLGLTIADFPNLFTVTGPGSPSVFTNMIPTIEQSVAWIADCLGHVTRQGYARIEADPAAQEQWTEEVARVAEATLYVRANSWYMGANIEGKPRRMLAYLGGLDAYEKRCNDVAGDGYRGFALYRTTAETGV